MKKLLLFILRLYGYRHKRPKGASDYGIGGNLNENYCWDSGMIMLQGIYYKHHFAIKLWKKRKLKKLP